MAFMKTDDKDNLTMFNKLLTMQKRLISNSPNELKEQFDFMESALVSYCVAIIIYERSRACNADGQGRAGLVKLEGISQKYNDFLKCAIDLIKPEIISNKKNNGIEDIECYLHDDNSRNNESVYVRNHGTKVGVLYISSDSSTTVAIAEDTGYSINSIDAKLVINKFPEAALLPSSNDNFNFETFASNLDKEKFNNLKIAGFFKNIKNLHKRIQGDTAVYKTFPRLITLAFSAESESSFSSGLCNNDLSEASRYIVAILYLLSLENNDTPTSACRRLEEAMGNALPVCDCPRNSSAFTAREKSLNKKQWQSSWKNAINKDLHTGANLSRPFDKKGDKTVFDHLCDVYNESASNFSEEERDLIDSFIREYKTNDINTAPAFISSWKCLYCIDWPSRLEYLFSTENKKRKGPAKKVTWSENTKSFLDENKALIKEEVFSELFEPGDDFNEYFSDLQETAKLVDKTRDNLTSEELEKIQDFFSSFQGILESKDKQLFNAWSKSASQLSKKAFSDFREGFCSVLFAANNYFGLQKNSDNKNIKFSKLKINVGFDFDAKKNTFDRSTFQAICYFSLMYGPLLRELQNDQLYDVVISSRDLGKNVELLWNLKKITDPGFKLAIVDDSSKKKKSISLHFSFELFQPAAVDKNDSAKSNSSKEAFLSLSFDWNFESSSVANSLIYDVLSLLGSPYPYSYDNSGFLGWFKSALESISESEFEIKESVLQVPHYEYNLAGTKGVFKELSLSANSCLVDFAKNSNLPPRFISDKSTSIFKLVDCYLNYYASTINYVGNLDDFNNLKEDLYNSLDKFIVSYCICLRSWLFGELSLSLVQNCLSDLNNFYVKAEDTLSKKCRVIILGLLNIGIAFDKSEHEYVKNSAIVCPWHLESLKATALKNERVLGLWRLFSLDKSSAAKNHLDNSDINFSMYQQGLFAELAMDTYLEIIPNREYLNPITLRSIELYDTKNATTVSGFKQLSNKTFIDTILSANSSKDGYVLFTQNNEIANLTDADIELVNNLTENCITDLGEVRNEVNIALYNCMHKALPLNLIKNWIEKGFLRDNENINRINLSVIFSKDLKNNSIVQEIRYKTESALKQLVHENPTLNYGVQRRFSISVGTEDRITSKSSVQSIKQPLFDLCILFDTFKTNQSIDLESFISYDVFSSEHDVIDDKNILTKFIPASSEYNQSDKRSLIRHMQSTSSAAYLKAISFVADVFDRKDHYWHPSCAAPGIDKLRSIIDAAHKLGSIVLTCDEFAKDSYFFIASNEPDGEHNKIRILQHKRLPSSGRNIFFSACDNSISASLEEVVAQTLKDGLGNIEKPLDFSKLANIIYEDALSLSGSIVLRAYNFHNSLFEMIGVVLSNFIVNKSIEYLRDQFEIKGYSYPIKRTIMLDDYKSYLGLDLNKVADLLAIDLLFNEDAEHCLLNFVFAESKFYKQKDTNAANTSLYQAYRSASSMYGHFSYEKKLQTDCDNTRAQVVRFDKSHFVSRVLSLIWPELESTRNESSSSDKVNKIKSCIKSGRFSCLNTSLSIFTSFKQGTLKLNDCDFTGARISQSELQSAGIKLGQLQVGADGLFNILSCYLKNKSHQNTQEYEQARKNECNDLVRQIDLLIKSNSSQDQAFSNFLISDIDKLIKNAC
ncbi:hypothetical protein [Anaerobiospirillum succiniciproducens]|uniref:hypothetical protein n=1 Tax=Anaerobiospirillum succiniciproducens TaxID=13335 RepID=UPI00248DCA9D|nr:hypothetical protein [Anaerobiospirillum succiniciproducens]